MGLPQIRQQYSFLAGALAVLVAVVAVVAVVVVATVTAGVVETVKAADAVGVVLRVDTFFLCLH